MRYLFLLTLLLGAPMPLVQVNTPGADYYVEAVVDNPAPYVGQQITYSFRLYQAVDLENLLYEPSTFEGFWQAQMGPATQSTQQINGRQYQITQIDTALFPTRVGDIEIAPSAMILPETVFRDEQRLATNPVTVQVQPLPEGAPVGFSGAVGRFNMQATLDRQSATLGEPITLQLTITGSGNLEQLPAPELPVPEDWRIYQNPPRYTSAITGGLLVGEKTYTWLIVPSHTGTQTLPEVTLSYFDPEALAYRSVSTSPVTLEIFPADSQSGEPSPNLDAILAASGTVLSLKPVPAVIQSDSLYPGLPFWLLWLIPPGCAAVSGWWLVQQRRRQANRLKIRQSRALRRAQGHLDTAQNVRSNDACRTIAEAVFIYFGEKLNREGAGLNQSDLQRAMEAHQVSDLVSKRIFVCLEQADEGRYAPSGSIDSQMLLRRTQEALAALDAAWKTE